MMYSSVARSDPPALICVTTIAVMITQRPCKGTFRAWATASAAKADTVMRTQKRQRGLEARSKAVMRCEIAGRSVVFRHPAVETAIRAYLHKIQAAVAERCRVQGGDQGPRGTLPACLRVSRRQRGSMTFRLFGTVKTVAALPVVAAAASLSFTI